MSFFTAPRSFLSSVRLHVQFSVGRMINVILGILLFLSFAFTTANSFFLERSSSVYTEQLRLVEDISRLRSLFVSCNDYFAAYIKTGNRTNLALYNETVLLASQNISAIQQGLRNDENIYLLRSIEKAFEIYFYECCNASFQYTMRNFDYYHRLYYAEKIQLYLQDYCDELQGDILAVANTHIENIVQIRSYLKIINAVFVALLLLVFIFFARYVSANITRPLEKLVTQANEVAKGNFSVSVPVYNEKNSVGVLTGAFNRMAGALGGMVERLKTSVETEKQLLREQRKNLEYKELLNRATFLALQAQTNPHFLFNTLNTIGRTISLGKPDTALQMLDCLASLLRYSLSDADAPVSLEEEVDSAREYLTIQKYRFGDRLTTKIDIRDGTQRSVRIPRFTLQPLVENAVIHGLAPREAGGKLVISAKKRRSGAVIRIFDNGGGIQKAKLAELNTESQGIVSQRIGVQNTRKRLAFFAEKKRNGLMPFSIISKEGSWTMVIIRLAGEKDV
ncbi:MAG: histidine kinase [Spirochaetales bacterium]|jgi:sensor histidine kinase YesM|nr:histidine kinase [Spirochaetales bacterium]